MEELLQHPIAIQAVGLAGLAALCLLLHFLIRRLLVRVIEKLVHRSTTDWDDALHHAEVFERIVALVPAVVGWYGVRLLPEVGEAVEVVVSRAAFSVILLFAGRTVIAFFSAVNEIYSSTPENRDRPIKGYIQVVQILIGLITGVLILATLLDRSPLIFISGIGAMTAVILLIFRDTILSLVASIQITSNDMIRVGDWIEMPAYGADGDVIDVALHTVKVQNWDKTITSIPTHKLISDSFKNWRFMSLSGGRRIKRALHIEIESVRFLEPEEIERFRAYRLLADYIDGKTREIVAHNDHSEGDRAINANIRRLTNLGTFRAYVEQYLRNHPSIHQGMTLIVRQLASGPTGVPIEIYCFTNTTDWTAYEAIQGDLFDHFFAVAPDFGLRTFENPSGADLRAVGTSAA